MLQATNDFVFVIRDETEKESGGLLIPDGGAEKPHHGTIFSIGDLVQDKKIRAAKGKRCAFHKGIGFDMEIDGQIYLVLTGSQIIGIL